MQTSHFAFQRLRRAAALILISMFLSVAGCSTDGSQVGTDEGAKPNPCKLIYGPGRPMDCPSVPHLAPQGNPLNP